MGLVPDLHCVVAERDGLLVRFCHVSSIHRSLLENLLLQLIQRRPARGDQRVDLNADLCEVGHLKKLRVTERLVQHLLRIEQMVDSFVVIAVDQDDPAVELVQVRARWSATDCKVSKVIDEVVRSDNSIPVADQNLVHLSCILKRAFAVFDDVFVTKVGVTCKKDAHSD